MDFFNEIDNENAKYSVASVKENGEKEIIKDNMSWAEAAVFWTTLEKIIGHWVEKELIRKENGEEEVVSVITPDRLIRNLVLEEEK